MKSSDGTLELTLPAGALAADTEIFIQEVPAADVFLVSPGLDVLKAFKMTPAGLTLAIPATLTFPVELASPAKENVHDVSVPVAIVTGDMLQVPQDQTIQEIMRIRIDQNNSPHVAGISLRGFPEETAVGIPVGAGDLVNIPILTTTHDWDQAPRVEETFQGRLGFETSAGLSLRASIQYQASDLVGITTTLQDGDSLTPLAEGETPGGGYRLDYSTDYYAAYEGSAVMNWAMAYEVRYDYSQIYGEQFDHPDVHGYTAVEHVLEVVEIEVQPKITESDLLDNGIHPGERLGERIQIIRDLPGNKHNNRALTSGGDGTRIRSIYKSNPMAITYNDFHTPNQSAYGAFMARDGSGPSITSGLTFFQYGSNGILFSLWDDVLNDFGWGQLGLIGRNVTDGQPYGGDLHSGGVVFVDNSLGDVRLYEWDEENTWFNPAGTISSFPGATANPVTAAVRPEGGAVVVTDGFPGKVFYHARVDYFADAVELGDAGDSPRSFGPPEGSGRSAISDRTT